MIIQILKHSIFFCAKSILLFLFVTMTVTQVVEISKIVNPIIKVNQIETTNNIKENLAALGAPKHEIQNLSKSIKLASDATNINDRLILALMFTESGFKRWAISPKGYKGLMQTTIASYDYSDVDTLMGARVLQEKLRITKGDLYKALALYKGGDNPEAWGQAKKVLEMYTAMM